MILISNDFCHNRKMYNFDSYNALLAIATNIPVLLMTAVFITISYNALGPYLLLLEVRSLLDEVIDGQVLHVQHIRLLLITIQTALLSRLEDLARALDIAGTQTSGSSRHDYIEVTPECIHTHTHTHTHTHARTHTLSHTHTRAHLHTPTHTHAHTYTHAHAHTHTHTLTHAHTHTHTLTHTDTHTHTHTHRFN